LTPEVKGRLRRAIAGCLVNPFVDDILDFNWEAIWHYCHGLPIPDPLNETRKKYLHDAVDAATGVGWSLKTQQISCAIADCDTYAVVIARADVFGKGEALGFPRLSRKSRPGDIGQAVLKLWADKVAADRTTQGVRESRVATLLKPPKRTEFGVHETVLRLHATDEVSWAWAESGKGLWGTDKATDRRVYRWYPSGGQLFEIFDVPKDVVIVSLEWRRLAAEPVLAKLEELAKVPLEKLVDERPKGTG